NSLRLRKFALNGGRKVIVVKHHCAKKLTGPAAFQLKGHAYIKCIVAVVKNAPPEHRTTKLPPESGQTPFAAKNGRRIPRSRKRFVLRGDPKKSRGGFISNCTLESSVENCRATRYLGA